MEDTADVATAYYIYTKLHTKWTIFHARWREIIYQIQIQIDLWWAMHRNEAKENRNPKHIVKVTHHKTIGQNMCS